MTKDAGQGLSPLQAVWQGVQDRHIRVTCSARDKLMMLLLYDDV